MIFIPGLNGKFDADILAHIKQFAVTKGIASKEFSFKKYSLGDKKFEYTFEEQKCELKKFIDELDSKAELIIFAKSLGAIPLLLLERTDIRKILFSPIVAIGKEGNIFNIPFKDLKNEPIPLESSRFKNCTIFIGKNDPKVDALSIMRHPEIKSIIIETECHSLPLDKIRDNLNEELMQLC